MNTEAGGFLHWSTLPHLAFTKRLREGVRREDAIEVDSIEVIGMPDITPELARASGFLCVLDLLKMAKHGKGEHIYLLRSHYAPRTALTGEKPAKSVSAGTSGSGGLRARRIQSQSRYG